MFPLRASRPPAPADLRPNTAQAVVVLVLVFVLDVELVLVLLFVPDVELVLVLLFVPDVELVLVLVRVIRFGSYGLKVAPTNQAGQQRIDAPGGFACGASLFGITFASGPRHIDGSRRFTTLAAGDGVDAPFIGAAETSNAFSDVQADAFCSPEKLISQFPICDFHFLDLSQEADRKLVGQELFVGQKDFAGHARLHLQGECHRRRTSPEHRTGTTPSTKTSRSTSTAGQR